MSDLIKPPILDDTGQTIKTKLTAILQSLQNIAIDLSLYMKKGVDYVTAGKASGTTLGTKATAEGNNNTASGNYSHAEGSGNTASSSYCHAEGNDCTASGFNAHAEGNNAIASGMYTHAEGYSTRAYSNYQHVEGKYNVSDSSNVYAHIIGNGTADNARSNAFAVSWDGDCYAGRSNGINVSTAQGQKKIPTSQDVVSYLNSNFVNDSGWIEDTLTAFGTGKVHYRKTYNTINFFLVNQNLTGMTANASNVVYTLPSAYYPHHMVVARNYNDNGFIQINTNGTVVVNPTSTSGWFSVCLTYLTA